MDEQRPVHQPVMVAEVLEWLEPQRGGLFVDGTVGLGGHAAALLAGGATRVIGFDRDQSALALAATTLTPWTGRAELVHADYRHAAAALDARGIGMIDGALLDLGVSSMQFDAPGRGFSFRRDEPLDMRMDQSAGPSAADLIRTTDEETLADAIYQFGEERHSRRVARAIVAERDRAPIETTGRLAEIVRRAVPHRGYQRIDPATRTFQGLRIWVNEELDGLDQALRMFLGRLAAGGRLVVISFHSLEDRVVKHTLRAAAADDAAGVRVLTKRPVLAADEEVQRNPRARSAKLRAAERVGSRQ
ncbi:MAG: 16S rRNA (cytosine(1402)-N(4))-methyltransferase RsmH [Vicinamibacterales bacterium]